MQIQMKVLDSRAKQPTRGSADAAGYDIVACIDEPMLIERGAEAVLIPTGLAMFSDTAYAAGIILPRSGLGHKQGLVMGNTLGLIDGDYQGEWFVSAWNRGQRQAIKINPGDRIAQVIFVPVLHPIFIEVANFTSETVRGSAGYGSTGVQS